MRCIRFCFAVVAVLSGHVSGNVAPVFSPDIYSITVGRNDSVGTVVATLGVTDADPAAPDNTITLSVDGTGGSHYFEADSSTLQVKILRPIDVEFGEISWDFKVVAVDGAAAPLTATATISVMTYQSTTLPSTTFAPAGYDWLANTDNVILLGCVGVFVALLLGTCVLCMWRFHRVGTCLPESCPTIRMCKGSFKRTCDCCPLPFDFDKKNIKEDDDDDNDDETSVSYSFGRESKMTNGTFTDGKGPLPGKFGGKPLYPKREHFRV